MYSALSKRSRATYKLINSNCKGSYSLSSTKYFSTTINNDGVDGGTSKISVQSDISARKINYNTPTLMTASEAFVETLVAQGVSDIFGIVGSAFMDALDIFPEAGIRFISTQHEQNAVHMADGYSRVSNKAGLCIGQNGPGVTNFITGLAAAYYAHSPVIAITPECGTNTIGLGGFQEMNQIPLFREVVKYQGNITNYTRIPEIVSRAFDYAMYERGPTQINIPRDIFYNEYKYSIPAARNIEYPVASSDTINNVIQLLKSSCNPVILAGGGCIMGKNGVNGNTINIISELSEYLSAPVATTYLHNDSFTSPSSNLLSVGPLGYQGFESAMKCINQSDCILAIGTRINPFGTLPQYNFDYWPSNNRCKVIQIDIDQRRLGLSKYSDLYVHGDAYLTSKEILNAIKQINSNEIQCLSDKDSRLNMIKQYKNEWETKLNEWTYGDYGNSNNSNKLRPRRVLRELEKSLPPNSMVSTDIGNICSVANSYLRFNSSPSSPSFLAAMTFGNCQYSVGAAIGAKVASPNRPAISYTGDGAFGMSFNELLTCLRENIAITSVVFNNGQWGAEKKNQVLWFGDRYIGVNLNNPENFSFAKICNAMGLESIQITHIDQIHDAMNIAIDNQMNKNKTTVLEIMCTKELGDPFRRDAMKLPQRHLDKYKHTIQTNESSTGQVID